MAPVAIELGAEFVHGLPHETWALIRDGSLTAYEQTPRAVRLSRGRVLKQKQMAEVLPRSLGKHDKSFPKSTSGDRTVRQKRKPGQAATSRGLTPRARI